MRGALPSRGSVCPNPARHPGPDPCQDDRGLGARAEREWLLSAAAATRSLSDTRPEGKENALTRAMRTDCGEARRARFYRCGPARSCSGARPARARAGQMSGRRNARGGSLSDVLPWPTLGGRAREVRPPRVEATEDSTGGDLRGSRKPVAAEHRGRSWGRRHVPGELTFRRGVRPGSYCVAVEERRRRRTVSTASGVAQSISPMTL